MHYNHKVSIIMGAYNEEKNIGKCIESILKQTFSDFELIICDDCSTDSTREIIQFYANKDNRIKLIKNERNLKLAASLNKCLKYSKSKYIARMDADDICLEDRILKQVRFLDEHPEYEMVGGGARIFDGNNISGLRLPKEYPSKNDVIYGPPFIHPTIMIRKNILLSLQGYDTSGRTIRGQDWDLWFRFFSKDYSAYNIQEPLIIYSETKEDLKKRTFKTSIMYYNTAINGYKLLNVPKQKYIFALKPVVSNFVPNNIKILLRTLKKIKE